MGTVAASGGYYVAAAADKVMANPGTTTGSIGVIIPLRNLRGLLDKTGHRSERRHLREVQGRPAPPTGP